MASDTVHSLRESVEDQAEHGPLVPEDVIHDLELCVRTVVDQECGTLAEHRELGLRIMRRLDVDPHGPVLRY